MGNAEIVARSLAAIWHPCTQMKSHERFPLVPIAHALIAFPFVVRSLLPVMRSIKPNLREAARVLGASPLHVWRAIDVPILARALVVSAVFAFTVSMGEFGATALVR